MADVLVRKLPYGRGVFAARQFQQGECVLETFGSIVPTRSIYTIQIDHDKHIEPNPPVKYLNHACEPNLGVKINARGLPDFYAMRPIQQGEHLTFDYAMTEYTLTEMEQGHERVVCACGAPTCRGQLGSYHELPSEIKRRYTGWIADYLIK